MFNIREVQFICFFFHFVVCAFDVISKNPLPTPNSQRFTPMLPSKSLTVLALLLGL